MRHRVHGRKLGRTSAHRKAMFRNQLTALFTHERIITTVAKAKDLRPQAERMVTLARTGTLANRRRILSSVSDKEVVEKLFSDIAPRFADRPGGYTRIMRLGRRHGDGAEMAIIEFVDFVPTSSEDKAGGDADKPSLMDRAKGMFGGGARGDADEAPEVEAAEDTAGDEPEEIEAAVSEAEPSAEEAAPEPEPEAVTEEPAPVEAEVEPEQTEAPVEEPTEDDEEKKD